MEIKRNEQNNTTQGVGGQRPPELTSKSLGISAKRETDITGYVLKPQEITEGVITMLIKCGVPRDAVHSVRIGKDRDNHLEVIARIEEDAIRASSGGKISSWIGISERATNLKIRPEIYNGLRDKAYIGTQNLHYQKEKIKGDNYVAVNFDSDVLLAFMYDIDYTDEFLKVSPIEFGTGKNQRKKLGYSPCGAIVTFSTKGFNPNQVREMHGDRDR